MSDIRKYLESLAQEAGVEPETRDALLKALENEKFQKGIADGVLRQEDYSRSKDELRKLEQTTKDYYNDLLKTSEHNRQVVADREAALAKYQDAYGPLEGGAARVAAPPADSVTKKELEEALTRLGQQSIMVTKKAMFAASDHLKRFGEVLDPDALEKLALEKGLSIDMAYQELIRPKLDALQTKTHDDALKAAREEGARDALSRHKLPIDDGVKEPHPFFTHLQRDPATAAPTEGALRDSFVTAFNEAGQKA